MFANKIYGKAARTYLCGGQSAMVVAAATVVKTNYGAAQISTNRARISFKIWSDDLLVFVSSVRINRDEKESCASRSQGALSP